MIQVSRSEFDGAVEAALREVPAEFQKYLDNVVIEVQDRPGRDLMDEGFPDDLLGLYSGSSLQEEFGAAYHQALPDRIILFRENLCDMCESREELVDEIRITLLHEIGHHFGLDEDRLDELGYA